MPPYLSRYSDMSHPTIPFLYTSCTQVTLSENSACGYKTSFALFKIINHTIPIHKICPVPFLFIRHRHLPALSYLWTRKSLRIQYFTIIQTKYHGFIHLLLPFPRLFHYLGLGNFLLLPGIIHLFPVSEGSERISHLLSGFSHSLPKSINL